MTESQRKPLSPFINIPNFIEATTKEEGPEMTQEQVSELVSKVAKCAAREDIGDWFEVDDWEDLDG